MPTNDEPPHLADRRTESALSTSLLALVVQIVVQSILGVFLSTYYRSEASQAYPSVQSIPVFLRSFHFWGSAIVIIHALAHMSLATWFGKYRKPYGHAYWLVLGMFALSMAVQVTGNLLPFDRHSVQSANTEAAIGSQVPFAGGLTNKLMLGGAGFSDRTLTLWYGAHWAIGILMVIAALYAIGTMRKLSTPNLGMAIAPLAVAAIVAGVVPAPLGTAATHADYGMFNALPGWYVWPLHGTNVVSTRLFGTGWVGTALLPGIVFLFLASLPVLYRRVSQGVVRAVFGIIVLVFGVAAVGFGGRFAALTGNRDPANTSVATTSMLSNPGQNGKLAIEGQKLFNSIGCANCHGPDGLQAKFGPSLADVYKEHPTPDFYMKYIHDPKSVDPSASMPAFLDLKQSELQALAEFLRFPRK